MDFSTYELCELIDCVNNRIADLEDVAAYGDVEYVKGEIESLNNLVNRLEKALEANNA
tara:strand:- start:99 stop:272 length:174 start_codon:yes stop_codon:yes gene_type:complete